jgi:uridylate kinase
MMPHQIYEKTFYNFFRRVANQPRQSRYPIFKKLSPFNIGRSKKKQPVQTALRGIAKPSNNVLDWMGIYTTRVNARLVQLMFGKVASNEIVKNPNKKALFNTKILVASGWKPGRSTDFVAVMLGKAYGASTVINLSNIDYLYDKDPHKFRDAKKIESVSWTNFRKIVGNKWDPGKNTPFDPTAAKLAQKINLQVIIANGKNLENLKNILTGNKFQGTTIH